MRESRRRLAIGLCAALVPLLTTLATSSAAATATPGRTTRIGIAYGDSLTWMTRAGVGAALDDAVALHARWVRADLSWADVQPDGPDQHRWAPFDRVVRSARARGLRVLPLLGYSPAWARDPGCGSFACPPRNAAAFARFARLAVRRYAPLGVHTWEIWNEPNLPTFWPHPDPDRYAALLRVTADAVRQADPHARVLLGGLAAADSTTDGAIDPRTFLGQVCAAGACRGLSGVAYHPYTFPHLASDVTAPGTAWNRIAETHWSLRGVLDRYGFPRMKIWATEFGAPTGGPGTSDHVTEARQAEIAADAVVTAARSPDVTALFWYTDRDDLAYLSNVAYFGLRRSDGSKKPAWSSFAAAAGRYAATR